MIFLKIIPMIKTDSRLDQPNTLIKNIDDLLKKYGAQKFLNGSDEECQKGREAFFAYFFIVGFRRISKRDWWIHQPEQFPDLQLISFGEKPTSLEVLQYELVTIPNHYSDIEKMIENVTNKIEGKKYAPGAPCGLLVFSNNAQSDTFEKKLYGTLDKIHPFIEVWTTHLEFSDASTIKTIVISKIRPQPVIRFAFSGEDSELYRFQTPPDYIESVVNGNLKYFRIKPEARIELKKESIRRKLRDH